MMKVHSLVGLWNLFEHTACVAYVFYRQANFDSWDTIFDLLETSSILNDQRDILTSQKNRRFYSFITLVTEESPFFPFVWPLKNRQLAAYSSGNFK